jgi:uncharacterized protein (DUF488 family)
MGGLKMFLPDGIWTVGHSTRSLENFISLLRHYGVEAIADVRRFPGSRRMPQFGEQALGRGLMEAGLAYRWIPELGGRRRPRPDTPNTAWRNASFRGYADHLATKEFEQGLEKVAELAASRRTALMCAELLWWRCHRALVSDVLTFSGVSVWHIQDEKHLISHPYTSAARVAGDRLIYEEGRGKPLNKAQAGKE